MKRPGKVKKMQIRNKIIFTKNKKNKNLNQIIYF